MNGAKNLARRIPGVRQVECNLCGSEAVFTRIYRTNAWRDGESVSGTGSNINNTEVIRRELPNLFKDQKVSTILDIPCGDFNWMRYVDLSNIRYIGGDIVADLIQQNRVKYEEENILFRHLDLTKDDLPKVDLIICRDCLVHLSFKDIFSALKNICLSKSTYLLTTTFTAHQSNQDILPGNWFPLNLSEVPFSLPDPIRVISDKGSEVNGPYQDGSLGLWRIEDIASVMKI